MLSKGEIVSFLKTYKQARKKQYHIKNIGLFGSFARGEETETSDIDIVVDFEKADLLNQIRIKQELQERFDRHVDVIALWKGMNPKLLRRIQRDVIYV